MIDSINVFSTFYLGPESENFTLTVGGYSGNAENKNKYKILYWALKQDKYYTQNVFS